MRTRCSPRWARWRPPRRSLNGLAECGAVDLWKRCVDGGQAEGGAWGDRDRNRDGDRHRGGAGVGGERSAFGDGWIEARPTPTSALARTRRHTQTRTRAHRQTRPHGTTALRRHEWRHTLPRKRDGDRVGHVRTPAYMQTYPMRSPRSGPSCHAIRTRCSPRWARWRPRRPCMDRLAECGGVDLWKRCVDGGQAEGGAWGDRDRDRDGDRHRGGAGVGGEGVAFSDGWIEARPTPTSAPALTRRHTQTRTHTHRQTRRLVIEPPPPPVPLYPPLYSKL